MATTDNIRFSTHKPPLYWEYGNCTVIFRNSTTLGCTLHFDTKFSGGRIFFGIVQRSQTPWSAIHCIAHTIIETDGSCDVQAKGSGFVNGHIVELNYLAFAPV